MRALEINLASRPFRNDAPLWAALTLVVLAVAGFTTWNVRRAFEVRAAIAAARGDMASTDQTLAGLDQREAEARRAIAAIDIAALGEGVLMANEFLVRRGMSWTKLFEQLERVQPYEVRMTSIRPMPVDRTREPAGAGAGVAAEAIPVAVNGVAQSLAAFLEFERALLLDDHFARVEPVRTEFEGDGQVQFELRFQYDPEGRLGIEAGTALPAVLPAVAEAEADSGATPGAATPEGAP